MTTAFVDLDVRPILRAGGEPFEKIMEAVSALGPGEGLRLFSTFEPKPLFHMLGSKGFSHEARELGGSGWEILFRPIEHADRETTQVSILPDDDLEWPNPVQHLDNRDLDPPEPMVRILAAIETLKTGDVLSALLCREPVFLLPELAKRGCRWRGAFEPDSKTYKLLVRV